MDKTPTGIRKVMSERINKFNMCEIFDQYKKKGGNCLPYISIFVIIWSIQG
ncbi:MAG: hypothetical protein ACI85Q_000622 [Salibacteraceae bacterium]|jgi:hypothetical protein